MDLQLEEAEPPGVLFHGTVERFLASIMAEGLKKARRHHVQLSKDVETARNVAPAECLAMLRALRVLAKPRMESAIGRLSERGEKRVKSEDFTRAVGEGGTRLTARTGL